MPVRGARSGAGSCWLVVEVGVLLSLLAAALMYSRGMANSDRDDTFTRDEERRLVSVQGQPSLAGVPVRDDDVESARGLHSVAKLFRVLSAILLVLMALQVASGLTSSVEISYGVLIAEAMRLVIFAGLLWGAGDLADMVVKSHRDLRASRILLGRVARLLEPKATPDNDSLRGRGDATY